MCINVACCADIAVSQPLLNFLQAHSVGIKQAGAGRGNGYASSGVRLENLGNADSESRAESAFPSGLHRPNGDIKFVRKGLLCVIIQSAEFDEKGLYNTRQGEKQRYNTSIRRN